MTEDEKYLQDHFLISIKSGLQSLEDIIDESLEIVEDERLESEVSELWLKETIEQQYELNEEASKQWAHPTDPERLVKVFDKLCERSVLALHNVGYTASDAIHDVHSVWENIEDNGGKPIVGYCYYHGQDLERVIKSRKLALAFCGKKENNDKDTIAIGNIVAQELKSEGFAIEWDGSAASRIEVVNFHWHNAFTSDEDVEATWAYDRAIGIMTK